MSKVTLDVGGKIFRTTKETLCLFDCYFKSALGFPEKTDQEPSTELFIDRDPKIFHVVLNLLRNAHSKDITTQLISVLDQPTLKMLIIELDFYKLQEIKEIAKEYVCHMAVFRISYDTVSYDKKHTKKIYPESKIITGLKEIGILYPYTTDNARGSLEQNQINVEKNIREEFHCSWSLAKLRVVWPKFSFVLE